MKLRRVIIVATVIGIVAFAISMGRAMWLRHDWFDVQQQQLAAIKKLEAYPPRGWERRTWNNSLVTLFNVWGNVTFSPNYSKISNSEMRELRGHLEQIVAGTNRSNSIESVDRMFLLLLQRGQKIEFITTYRDEFKTHATQISNASSPES